MSVNGVTKNKGVRSSLYSAELADLICERIAIHSWGLEKLCAYYKDLPDKTTINRWRNKYPEFREKFAQAKVSQIETLVDEIIDIADDSSNDIVFDENRKFTINHENINRSRLRIDTRKWLSSKLVPKLYGDKEEFVNLKFPSDVKDADSLLPMSTEVFRALGNQEITPGQAKILLGTLKDYSSAIAIIDLNQKMSTLLENGTPNHATIEGE